LSMTHVVGVDPGLVHTGVVSVLFQTSVHRVEIRDTVIAGPDAGAVAAWIGGHVCAPRVYVEQYRTRQHLSSDMRMIRAEQDLRRALPDARFLPNMGIKRVITQSLMELLEVWSFPTTTHHQDLRAAARIAMLGMVKDDSTNEILADVVRAYLDGQPWTISHL
jgi:hypothetical protein